MAVRVRDRAECAIGEKHCGFRKGAGECINKEFKCAACASDVLEKSSVWKRCVLIRPLWIWKRRTK